MKKKILSLTLVVCLLAIAVVGGTLAYFTDTDNEVTNTFTVGNVQIKLDETVVDVYGDATTGGRVEEGNAYKLIPGHTYTKDPMVTVEANSEESYVRMLVTIDAVAMEVFGADFLPQNYVEGWNPDVWETTKVVKPVKDDNENTVAYQYEFRYFETVNTLDGKDLPLDPLFDSFNIPADLDHDDIEKLNGLNIVVKAEAIQADTFADADAAFAAIYAE